MSDTPVTRLRVTGDSMTEYGTWPALVAAATGWTLAANNARSGQTSTEIALREGALRMTVVVTARTVGDTTAVRPLHPTTSFRQFIDEPMDDILIAGDLAGTPGELRHAVRAGALEQWSFVAPAGAADDRAAGEVLEFTPAPQPIDTAAVSVLWCGRNNVNSDALRDLDAMVHRLQQGDRGARFLVLGVANSALEPRGTSGHAALVALNADLARRYGSRFVDVRSALLADPAPESSLLVGGRIDGALDTGANDTGPLDTGPLDTATLDAADRLQDVPPRSLRLDTVHLAESGDRLVARAVLTRLAALGWVAAHPAPAP